ncbi:hypothetical protein GF357_03775 [Candidatus Dojkabacteria bacterium]|nr:hypothetical protein [Candidatus Dojkabacteria bacterium]
MAGSDKSKGKKTEKKVVKPVLTLQIVHYCCTKCAEEIEEIRLCSSCGSTMRVVEVVEKYGNEAEEYLKRYKKENGHEDEIIIKDASGAEIDETENEDLDEMDVNSEFEMKNDELGLLSKGVFNPSDDKKPSSKRSGDTSLSEILDESEGSDDLEDLLDDMDDGDGPIDFPEL